MIDLMLACGAPASSGAGSTVASAPPGDAAVDAPAPPPPIADLLLRAAEKGGVGDRVAAVAAWREAHAGFEKTIEPVVRAKCDSCATEMEYHFGLVRAEIDRAGGKPLGLVDDLLDELRPYLPAETPP